MSRKTSRPPRSAPSDHASQRTSIIYIVVTAVVVFGLIAAGLSSIDFGSLMPNDEPTPDYNESVVEQQRQVVSDNPDDPEQRAYLASLLVSTGNMNEAIREYEQALKLDPENAEIRLDFARSLQSNGYPQDAELQFLRVLEIEPNNHTAHYHLANLYWDWQPRRREEAIEHYTRVIEIAPDSFYAEQSQAVLDTMGQSTPIAMPSATP